MAERRCAQCSGMRRTRAAILIRAWGQEMHFSHAAIAASLGLPREVRLSPSLSYR